MSSILVTGAGGFVGRHIVSALLQSGHRIIAMDRLFDADIRQFWGHADQIDLIEGEINALPALEVDAVIHGAAVTAPPEFLGQTAIENFRANLDPMLNMLDWIRDNQVKRSIFISSSAVFRQTAPGPVYETDPTSPLGLYAAAKATIETLVETLRKEHNMDALVIRLSNIYGPMETTRQTRPNVSLVGRMVHEAITRNTITINSNEAARDWTLAPDVGRALHHLIVTPNLSYPLYQLASGQVFAPDEIAEIIQQHVPCQIVKVSEESKLTRLGYLSNQRLQEDTGFAEWTGFERGIASVIAWQQEAIA